MKERTNLLAYFALGAICIIWGTTYLALRVGVTQFPPFLFSSIRFLFAGPILLGLLFFLGRGETPTRKFLFHQAVSGLLMCSLGVGVVGWAETIVSSGLAAIICSVMPIWVILINIGLTSEEKPTIPIVVGLVIGLIGIILIFGEHVSEFSDSQYAFCIAMAFSGNICWSFGTVWMKQKNQSTDPIFAASWQMFFGGVFLIPMSLAFDDYTNLHWTAGSLIALGHLILFGSVAAYTCLGYAIKKLPVTIVSLYVYINPIVAVVLGSLILNEKLNVQIGIGILVTLAGIYIVNRGYQIKAFWKAQFSKQ